MINAQKGAAGVLLQPFTLTASGTTSQAFLDCKGFRYATIDVFRGTMGTGGAKPTALSLSECDSTSTSLFADIVAFTGGTATSATVGFVIPTHVTTAGILVRFGVDLTKRKRYLMLNMTEGTATYYRIIGAIVNLTKEEQSCETTTTKAITNYSYTTSFGVIALG